MTSGRQTLILGSTATSDSSQQRHQQRLRRSGKAAAAAGSADTDTEQNSCSSATATDFDEVDIFRLGQAQSTVSSRGSTLGGDEGAIFYKFDLRSMSSTLDDCRLSTGASGVSDDNCIFKFDRRPSTAAAAALSQHGGYFTEEQALRRNDQQQALLLSDELISSSAGSDQTMQPPSTTAAAVDNEAATGESTKSDESEQSIQQSRGTVSSAPRESKSADETLTPASKSLPASISTNGVVPPWSIGASEYATSASPCDALWKFKSDGALQRAASGRRRRLLTASTDEAMVVFRHNWKSTPAPAAAAHGVMSNSSASTKEMSAEELKPHLRSIPAEPQAAELSRNKVKELAPKKVAAHLPGKESQGACVPVQSDSPNAPETETTEAGLRKAEEAQKITVEFLQPSSWSSEVSLTANRTTVDSNEETTEDWWGPDEVLTGSPRTLTVRADLKDSSSAVDPPTKKQQDDGQKLEPQEMSESWPTCQVYATLSLGKSTCAGGSQKTAVKTGRRLKSRLPLPIAKNGSLGRPKSTSKPEPAAKTQPQPPSSLQPVASHSSQELSSYHRDKSTSPEEAKRPGSDEQVYRSLTLPYSSSSEDAGPKYAAEASKDKRLRLPGGDGSVKESSKASQLQSKKKSQLNSTKPTAMPPMPVVAKARAKQPDGKLSHSKKRSLSQPAKDMALNANEAYHDHDPKARPTTKAELPESHKLVGPRRSRSSTAKTQAPAASSNVGAPRTAKASVPRRRKSKEVVCPVHPPKDAPSLSGKDAPSSSSSSPSYLRDQSSSGASTETVVWTQELKSGPPVSVVGQNRGKAAQLINTGNLGSQTPGFIEWPPKRTKLDGEVGGGAPSRDCQGNFPTVGSSLASRSNKPRLPRPEPPRDFIVPPGRKMEPPPPPPPPPQQPPTRSSSPTATNSPPSTPSPRSTLLLLLQSDAARDSELSALLSSARPDSTPPKVDIVTQTPQLADRSHSMLQTLQLRSRQLGAHLQQQQSTDSSGAFSTERDNPSSGQWDDLVEVTSEVDEWKAK